MLKLLLCVPLLLAPVPGSPQEAGKSAEVGEHAVTFAGGTDLAKLKLGRAVFGSPQGSTDLHGKVVVVRFWSG